MNLVITIPALAFLALSLKAAAISGRVSDSKGHPVAGATVTLKPKVSVVSDADGSYRFNNLPRGSYALQAGKPGFTSASVQPLSIRQHETKTLNITLELEAPGFFDEPQFIVAGVTAGGYQGGHGSDVVLRSAEALTKATSALSMPPKSAPASGQADKYRLMAIADEKAGKFVLAAGEYRHAAELDASEANLFNWGCELLRHRADVQAIQVLTKSAALFPDSVRILLALATSYYVHGEYEPAAKYFFAASDVRPGDPVPYLFLGKVQSSAVTNDLGFLDRMERFARLHPESVQANYLYAVSLWNQRKSAGDSGVATHVRTLLRQCVELDPRFGPAHLLLGIVDSDRQELERAVAADPALEEAHYRLAQAYRETGNTAQAQREMTIYGALSKEAAERAKRERGEMRQFVFSLSQ